MKTIEEKRAYHAAYYVVNREKIKANSAAFNVANSEKRKAYDAAYHAANPNRRRIRNRNRRALKRTNGSKLSQGLVETLYKRQQGLCVCCKKPLGTDYHLDHIMPLALGGKNEDSNIQLLTARCNRRKGARHPIEYMQSRGLLL